MYSFMKLKMCSLLYFRTKQVVPSWKSNWRVRKSNPRPSACKADALPTELIPLAFEKKILIIYISKITQISYKFIIPRNFILYFILYSTL